MRRLECRVAVLAVLACWASGVWANLPLVVECGSKNCSLYEYCNPIHSQCSLCTDVCTEGIPNYDHFACAQHCQAYLHDKIYVRRDGKVVGNNNDDLRATVQRLQHLLTVTLTLTCITLLAVIAIITVQICNWKKNNVTVVTLLRKLCSKKNAEDGKPPGNGVAAQATTKPELRLEMPTTGTQSENSPVTLTTSISRRPAEDSALDYAYDNRAMSNSPSPNTKPHESNF